MPVQTYHPWYLPSFSVVAKLFTLMSIYYALINVLTELFTYEFVSIPAATLVLPISVCTELVAISPPLILGTFIYVLAFLHAKKTQCLN